MTVVPIRSDTEVPTLPRLAAFTLLPAAALLSAAAFATPAPAAPTAHAAAAKKCPLSAAKQRKLGATYVTSLKVTGVTCSAAEKVVIKYHACRHKHGAAGTCTTKVAGYKCTEKRGATIPTQYDSIATCKSGAKRIVQSYEQFT